MRNFLAFAALIAVIVGLIVGAVQMLGLPPIYAKIAIGIGAVIIAIRVIVDALQRFGPRGSGGGGSPEADARRAAKLLTRQRVKDLRRRLRGFVQALKVTQDPPRLRYRERRGAPWWLILGPEGHGKSALLGAAPGAREIEPGAVGEPRFFVADDAAFIEMPAEYHMRPETGPALAALLRDLRRIRPLHPISGVLLALRADLLLAAPEPALVALDATRRQYNALALPLAAQVPVDLILTQLDRVAGFAEFITNLPSTTGTLGITLPPRDGKASIQAAIRERLAAPDGVLDWVRQRCHALVTRAEPGTSKQPRLYGFWQQFDRLASQAAGAAGRLADLPLPGGDPLRVRGVYFTCAQPDPIAPEDQWMAALAQRLGSSLPPTEVAAPVSAAFTTALFTVELPRDGQFADRLRALHRRRFTVAATAALAAVVFTTVSVQGMTRSAQANLEWMQRTLDSARAVNFVEEQQIPQLAELDHLRAAALIWRTTAPDELGWGLFRGDRLADATSAAFRAAVCRGVLTPAAERSARPLRQFVARYVGGGLPSTREYEKMFAHLRQYLLLSTAPEAGEPDLWAVDAREVWHEQLIMAWDELDGGRPDPRRGPILQAHFELVRVTAAQPLPGNDVCAQTGGARGAARDEALVTATRQSLLRTPQDSALVDQMIESIHRNKNLLGIDIHQLTTATHLHGDGDVRPAFTRQGWLAFREGLDGLRARGGAEDWVVPQHIAQEGHRPRCERLRHLYVERYIQAWSAFFGRLYLDSPGNWAEAVAITTELTQQEPLKVAFQAIAEHTQGLPAMSCADVPMLPPMLVAIASRYVPPEPLNPNARNAADLARRFAALVGFAVPPAAPAGSQIAPANSRLASYHQRLAEVRAATEKAAENPAELPALNSALSNARSYVHELVQRANLGDWQDRVALLLRPPLDGIALLADEDRVGTLNREWCDAIVLPLQQTIATKYPFDSTAHFDARLDDLKQLFHPETGAIAKFRGEHLRGYVDARGNTIHTRDIGTAATLHLNTRVVDALDAAHKLGLLLFRDSEVGIDMGVTMACEETISKVVLTVDDTEHPYICSVDQSRQIHWPGKADKRRGLLDAHGTNGRHDHISRDGEFGLFRLLEAGAPKRRAGQSAFGLAYDFKRYNLGVLEMVVEPAPFRGGDLFYGFAGDRFLAVFRSSSFLSPPHALFAEHGFSCAP